MTTGWLGTKETFYLSPKRVSDISMKMLFSYISRLLLTKVVRVLRFLDAFLSLQPVALITILIEPCMKAM